MQLETLVIYKEVEGMFVDECVEAILQNDKLMESLASRPHYR